MSAADCGYKVFGNVQWDIYLEHDEVCRGLGSKPTVLVRFPMVTQQYDDDVVRQKSAGRAAMLDAHVPTLVSGPN